jgi:hypothetical protein
MKILLICEPRSGSTNLANWFNINKDVTTLFLPSDKNSKWYRPKFPYVFNTEHLVVKEDFYVDNEFENNISYYDKVICLYRENEKEQIESWCMAKKTNIWHSVWNYDNDYFDRKEMEFIKNLKKEFRNKFINQNFFYISYEELYLNNGIVKIKNYIGIKEYENIQFPVGIKYRQKNIEEYISLIRKTKLL